MQQIDWSLKIVQIFSNLSIDIINLPISEKTYSNFRNIRN